MVGPAQAAPQNRISGNLEATPSLPLRGSTHALAQARYDVGRLDPNRVLHGVTMYFSPSPGQQAELDELLRELQDPRSANFHAWLTPREYAGRFGISTADRDKIEAWLRARSLTPEAVAAGETQVRFGGRTGDIETAFGTEFHRYQVDGERHFANASNLSLPAALSGMVVGFRGLNDFRPHPQIRRAAPRFTSSISGDNYLAPGDLAVIYDINPLYSASPAITGSGVKIAVVGQTPVNLSDIADFRTAAAGLGVNLPVTVPIDSGSDTPEAGSEDLVESDLDLEWSGAIAREATIEFVYSRLNNGNNDNVIDALNYAITHDVAPIISMSYGDCEPDETSFITTGETWLQQANAQGQTLVIASGDTGAADCDTGASAGSGLAVDYPASSAYATGVGGTEFDEGSNGASYWAKAGSTDVINSALSYIPEVVWNDTAATGTLDATGGGASSVFSKPAWQTGTGVPAENARYVPDIAFAASNTHDEYLYCTTNSSGQASCDNGTFRLVSSDSNVDNDLTVAGGTSFGAPLFAGVLALAIQETGASGGLGNVNPRLYQLAASTPAAFHDITGGNNDVPCVIGSADCGNVGSFGYSAGVGYDPTTGLGTIDVSLLVRNWDAVSGSSSSSSGGSSSSGSSSSSDGPSGSSGASGSGGGGGAWSPEMLLLLSSLPWLRRRRRFA